MFITAMHDNVFSQLFCCMANVYQSFSVAWPMFITGHSLSFLSVNKIGGGVDQVDWDVISSRNKSIV